MKRILNTFMLCLTLIIGASCTRPQYDICIYGESASGVIAAIQAARMGKTVCLISKNTHVGGMVTSGLTATDMNRHAVIGGVTAEFYGKLYEYYMNPDVWRNQTRDEFMESSKKRTFTGKNDTRRIQWVYESGVAEKIMKEWLAEEGVTVIYETRLAEEGGVEKYGDEIRRIVFTDGTSLTAKMFIDASYEGDLMAASGVSYIVGRESKDMYDEEFGGIRINYDAPYDMGTISPYKESTGEILPYVDPAPWGEQGAADNRTQAYCYRVTLTDDPANQVEITRPENYNEDWYQILLGTIRMNPEIELKNIITFTPMPNRKTDTNHLDFFGASYPYPEASYAERAELEQLHKDYALGMMWFLGNDPRVPERLRNEMKRWGLAADEFKDNGSFPHQIYVREARRMTGEYVMTQNNLNKENRIEAPQPIGMGNYPLDCHYVSRVVVDGKLHNEGTMHRVMPPYPISFGSILPKKKECTNLLVTVCLSSSHVAYCSIRMEPNYMVLGQSAASAAALAIDGRCPVQDVNYDILIQRLLDDGQILEFPVKK